MTQGRPPTDEVAGEGRDIEEEPHLGARSQTRTVEGDRGGARTAPRAAFGPASAAPPANTDSDKTVKRPYPTAWGQTLPIGGAATEEKTKVARSVFSQTLGGEPSPAPQNASKAPAPATRSARPDEQEVEPLRVPSQSPSPAPFQQARGSAARTIMMAGAPPAPQPAAPQPPARQAGASAAPKGAEAAKPAPRAPAAAAKRTLALGSAEFAEGGAPAAHEPHDASASARPAPFGAPRAPNMSEPLQLQLDARDVLEHAEVEAPGRGSRAPLYAGIGVAILIAAAIAGWIGSRDKGAPVAEPALRGDGVLAQDSPQAAVPAAPAAAAPTPAAPAAQAPAAPAAAQPQPVPAQPAAAPAAAAPEEAAQEPKPETPKLAAKPVAKPEPKPASKPAARKRRGSSAPVVPDEPVSEDVRSARDALRSLDSEPVMKIQRSEDDFDAPKPELPDAPDLPEPPSPEE